MIRETVIYSEQRWRFKQIYQPCELHCFFIMIVFQLENVCFWHNCLNQFFFFKPLLHHGEVFPVYIIIYTYISHAYGKTIGGCMFPRMKCLDIFWLIVQHLINKLLDVNMTRHQFARWNTTFCFLPQDDALIIERNLQPWNTSRNNWTTCLGSEKTFDEKGEVQSI